MQRRLSGLDSAFLAAETEAAPLHVAAVLVLDPVEGEPATFERIRSHLAPRLRAHAIFRRRPVEVPLGLDHPVWTEDDFDLDAHLHRLALPAPGDRRALERLVGRLIARPLDRTRPLWALHVVEDLEDDRTALVAQVHHALVDGVGGADVFARLFDLSPDAPAVEADETPGRDTRRDAPPSRAALLRAAARASWRRPFSIARQAGRSFAGLTRRALAAPGRSPREPVVPAVFAAPETPLGGAITSRRSAAFGSADLDVLQDAKRAFDVKLNDVVLAVCTGALRRFLARQGGLPDGPLVAALPVSVAGRSTANGGATGDGRGEPGGNRVSAMTVELPVHLADPLARLSSLHRHLLGAKRAHRAIGREIGPDWLAAWAELAPPFLLSGLAGMYSRLDVADRHDPVVNLVVSNVPGPEKGLYCAGHRVHACHPLGPIYEGVGVNLTVLSYDGRLHFGWTACPDSVPALDGLDRDVAEAIAEVTRAARSVRAGRRRRPAPSRRPGRATAIPPRATASAAG